MTKASVLQSVIIEDQPRHSKALQGMLAHYCPNVRILATATTIREGIEALQKHQPVLAFLDVELEDGDCFELLERVDTHCFATVFTTAHDHYALKALRKSAVDYLLKPIAISDLKAAIEKVIHRLNTAPSGRSLAVSGSPQSLGKLALPVSSGFTLVNLGEVLYLQAQGNYTDIFLDRGTHITASKPLGEIERLAGNAFMRIHDRYLINLQHVQNYVYGQGGYVVLSDGSNVAVSARKRERLVRWMRSER